MPALAFDRRGEDAVPDRSAQDPAHQQVPARREAVRPAHCQTSPLPDETAVHMPRTYDVELLAGGFHRQLSPGPRRSMPTHPEPKARSLWVAM
ncbi:hypothetical protein EAO77_31185 [Streptomyces sp. t39]|nr:hypothetical protein EAO77_31185 [Streptomyces sp. t39]